MVDDRDIDMQNIIADYERYCYDSDLIPDDWKRMRVVLSGGTFDQTKNVGFIIMAKNVDIQPINILDYIKIKQLRLLGKLQVYLRHM